MPMRKWPITYGARSSVGDYVYTSANPGVLMCVALKTGKVV